MLMTAFLTRFYYFIAAACAATAVAATTLEVKLTGQSSTAASAAAAGPVDGSAAVAHVYQNILGLGAARTSSAALVSGLPTTDLLSRPLAALVVTGEALSQSVTIAQSSRIEVSAESTLPALKASAAAAWFFNDGLSSSSSLDVLAPALTGTSPSSTLGGASLALQWVAGKGFVQQRSGSNDGVSPLLSALPSSGVGVLACSEQGAGLLGRLGLSVVAGSTPSCPAYATADVTLDPAADAAIAQALSEAAVLVAVADAAPSAVKTAASQHGLALFRCYLSGLAEAVESGGSVPIISALRSLTGSAIALAEAALTSAADAAGRSTAIVLLTTTADDLNLSPRQKQRRLQVDATDPCIDFGNCSSFFSPSPTVAPAVAASVEQADVEAYHVALWTALLLGGALALTISVMMGMDAQKDPALYAQVAADPRGAAGAKAR